MTDREELKTKAPAPRTKPIQPGDWVALGLGDGRCPVGEVTAIDDQWVGVRLKNFFHGGLDNEVIAVRWAEVERVILAYKEDAEAGTFGLEMQDEYLGDFQTAWKKAKGGKSDFNEAIDTARCEAQVERSRARRAG